MTFSSYLEINILIDIFLIIIMSFLVLPRAPKLYVAVLLLNLAQYAVIIPLDPTGNEPARFTWSDRQSDSAADVYNDQRRLPASNPLELVGRARGAFSSVSEAMGGAGVTFPTATTENGMPQNFESGPPPIRPEHMSTAPRQVTLQWQSVLIATIHDPHAMWLGMRVFWLAAAFVLFIQRPLVGMAAACSNLIPVPFLVTAGPYLYRHFNQQEVVQRANAAVENPETLKDYVIQFATSNGLAVLLIAIIILGGIALLQRRHRLQALRQLKRLETFLDSSRYRVRLNGTEYEFAVDQNILMVNGLRFDIDTMRPESKTSHKWFIKPNNEIIFISKESPEAPAQKPRSAPYSYKRKS